MTAVLVSNVSSLFHINALNKSKMALSQSEMALYKSKMALVTSRKLLSGSTVHSAKADVSGFEVKEG